MRAWGPEFVKKIYFNCLHSSAVAMVVTSCFAFNLNYFDYPVPNGELVFSVIFTLHGLEKHQVLGNTG